MDWGGGVGDNYIQIKRHLPRLLSRRLKWTIIDGEKSAAIGRNFNPEVSFLDYSKVDMKLKERYDIVLFSGVTMYIPDFTKLAGKLCNEMNCDLFITRGLFSEAINNFSVLQYICPGDGPYYHRFIGVEEARIWNLDSFFDDVQKNNSIDISFKACAYYGNSFLALPEAYRHVYYYRIEVRHKKRSCKD